MPSEALAGRPMSDVAWVVNEAARLAARAKKDMIEGSSRYPVKLTVFCDDRSGMLKQLTAVISDDNANIRNIEARTADSQATIDMVIDIEDVKHLERIMAGLRKIPGIRDVQRLNKI